MKILVQKTDDPHDFETIKPNFIYNRFDLFCPAVKFEALKLISDGEEKVLQYRLSGKTAELGVWLMVITEEEIRAVAEYIRKKHPDVKFLRCRNSLLPLGRAVRKNHFRIPLPETIQEMEGRMSAKSRSKMRKKLRFAEEAYGTMTFLEYTGAEIPRQIVEAFFAFKQVIRGRSYGMTPEEYLNQYHVSHCYVLKFGETIGAIRFACEQCPVVNGENFTYNPELKHYSLGQAIFVKHLLRMVEKGHPEMFISGGDFEYKTHYGSIEDTVYDCELYLGGGLGALWHRMDPVGKLKTIAKRILRRGSGQARKPHTQTAQQKEEG